MISELSISLEICRCIEHIAAELLIHRSPASIGSYIFSADFAYMYIRGGGGGGGGGGSTQKALASGALR